MSAKQSRHGEIVAIRTATEPVTTGNTHTGTRVWTTVTTRITTPGPDEGRLVHTRMDPEEAITWAQRLIDVAGQTQEQRADFGHTD
ncbi:hypothetical protein ACPCSE_29325 [Streptomyces cellulosae]